VTFIVQTGVPLSGKVSVVTETVEAAAFQKRFSLLESTFEVQLRLKEECSHFKGYNRIDTGERSQVAGTLKHDP